MSAFAAAIAAIFSDPNMAADALWLPGGTPPGVAVRIVRRAADEVTGFGEARVWSETTRIDVMVAQVPDPRPGDRLVIGGETYEVQGEPIRDRERLVWALDLWAK